jgi:VCBS repeat-containing protein
MADNQAPATAPDTASVLEGVGNNEPWVQGNLFANDSDPENATLTLASVTYGGVTYNLANGSVDINTAYGRLFVAFEGTYYYIPNNQNGTVNALAPGQTLTETITYTVRDPAGATSSNTLAVTLNGADDPPTFTGSNASLLAIGGVSRLNLFFNGRDPEGQPLSVINVTGLQPGMSIDYTTNQLVVDLNNPFFKALPQGASRDWTVNFQVSDGTQATNGSYWLHVNGWNDAPVATPITAPTVLTEGGQSITIDALQNASDPDDGAVLSVVQQQWGSAFRYDAATHSFTIDPSDPYFNFIGGGSSLTLTLTYDITDGMAQTRTGITFTIVGQNDAPTANPDNATVKEQGVGSGLGSAVGNVRNNDTDPDSSDTRTISAFGQGERTGVVGQTFSGTYGSLQVRADGVYIYQLFDNAGVVNALKPGETLTETFFYTLRDSGGLTSTSTLTFTINGTNDAPRVQFNLLLTGLEGDEPETFDARLFVSDPEGDAMTVVNLPASLPPGLTFDATSQNFTFNPKDAGYDHLAAGATYRNVFTYGVSDGAATSNQRITVEIKGVNDAPVAPDLDGGTVSEGSAAVSLNALQGASDVDDGAVLSVVAAASLPAGVSYADGVFTLDPSHTAFNHLGVGQQQTVSVSYGVTDGTATVARTASWVVSGLNDAPTAAALEPVAATEGGAVVSLDGLQGATDPDDGAVLKVLAPNVLPDGVSFADGVFRLDPAHSAFDSLRAGEQRTVTVNFGVSDGSATADRAATFVVTGVNDAPLARADAATTVEKQAVTIPVLGNDMDPDAGDTLTLVRTSASAQGSTIALSGGNIVFTPGAGYDLLGLGQTAQETFTYTVRDVSGLESTASVTVTIQGAADGQAIIGGNKSEILPGTAADELIAGGNGEDLLNGLGGADRLFGENGKDTLQGGDGFDLLDGGAGADVLDGGAGADTLTGGEGPDRFVFSAGRDLITDFEVSDRIQISKSLAADFQALKSHISQDGSDAVITFGEASVTLQGVQASSLFAGDFVFV